MMGSDMIVIGAIFLFLLIILMARIVEYSLIHTSTHKHEYKKVNYYVTTFSGGVQNISIYTRLQCSCGKYKKVRLIKDTSVFEKELDREIKKLRELSYISVEELEAQQKLEELKICWKKN